MAQAGELRRQRRRRRATYTSTSAITIRNFRQLGEQPTFLSERNIDVVGTINLDRLLPRGSDSRCRSRSTKSRWRTIRCTCRRPTSPVRGIPGVRKPRNDVTTYSLTVRRSTPMNARHARPAGQQPVGDDELRRPASIARSIRTATRTTSAFARLSRCRRQRAHAARFAGWSNGALGGNLFRWNPDAVPRDARVRSRHRPASRRSSSPPTPPTISRR